MVNKFEETFSLHDKPKSGRPSLVEERKDLVMESLQTLQSANPHGHASSTHVSNATGIPPRSVCGILREEIGLYPYKLSTHQAITNNDKKCRLEFVEWLSKQ